MDVYGMPVPSSGGIAVGEILNLIEAYDERTGTPTSEVDDVQYLHRFSEASATAFADRNRYVGDVPGVPTAELLSQAFADERACLFDPTRAHPRPVPFGAPDGAYAECGAAAALRHARPRRHVDDPPLGRRPLGQRRRLHLDHRVDRRLRHHRARLGLPPQQRAHRLQLRAAARRACPTRTCPARASARARSMSPTMVVEDGTLELVAGSPGGASIITTVAQIILGHYERGLAVGDALAAPRLSSRNGATEQAEPAIAHRPARRRARGARARAR